MELTFTKNLNNEFVAEFEATADFNLHVEDILPRDITLLQRTAGGKYDVIHDFPQNPPLSNIMDYDFTALIYPKTIKVVCAKEPTYAAVVSDGEVTEIKSQSKEIEVTANGTTVVEPDAGFAYLNKVSVKTNVEQSGGGGGTELEGEYYLTKPNGRYWKLILTWDSLTEEQKSGVQYLYNSLSDLGSVYTCVGDKVHHGGSIPQNGIYYTRYSKILSNLGYSVARMKFDSNRHDLLSCFAWQEAYPYLPSYVSEQFPSMMTITSLFDYVKVVFELESGYTPSDEEVYAMLAQMFMIEPITKEEYEDMVSRAENEDY